MEHRKGIKMPVHIKHFDRDKALEAILYIAKNLHSPTYHSISKMLYLSDKLHLQEYGRLICGDRYIAMDNGPWWRRSAGMRRTPRAWRRPRRMRTSCVCV